jgi:GrpB-like predicted nucleotidyltransferase (UPF0157 family)
MTNKTRKNNSYKAVIIDSPDKGYELSSYDPSWKSHFSMYEKYITELFGENIVGIEHVGSTALPDMIAKPVIGIVAIVKDLSLIEGNRDQLVEDSFDVHFERFIAESYQIRKMRDGKRVANIHVFPVGHPHTHVLISERDYWLLFPESAKEYADTKQMICRKYGDDYKEYLHAKKKYLDSIEPKVLEWYEKSGQRDKYSTY